MSEALEELFLFGEEKMEKAIAQLKREFASVRTGRANPAVLDKIRVEYYGTMSKINEVAAVSVPEPRLLVIQPWDASILHELEKAILKSDIGITPNNDGKMIRLTFPPLTEERRKELVKQIKRVAEDSKVAVRNERRDCIETVKKAKKDSLVTEDELATAEKDVQKIVDKYIANIDSILSAKEKDLLSV